VKILEPGSPLEEWFPTGDDHIPANIIIHQRENLISIHFSVFMPCIFRVAPWAQGLDTSAETDEYGGQADERPFTLEGIKDLGYHQPHATSDNTPLCYA
jgi:hypothetical protein